MKFYYNTYMFGNDTITQISTNDFFQYLIFTFDTRGKQTIKPYEDDTSDFLQQQKYAYIQLTDIGVLSILRGLQGVKQFDKDYLPQPTSSIIIELYNNSEVVTQF